MGSNREKIKLAVLLVLVVGLYAFTGQRSNAKKISGLKIKFEEGDNLYLTTEAVNKLLIQNQGNVQNLAKENLDLNTVEKALKANEMVKNAQVYLTVNGELTSKIVQRKPLGRVEGNAPFYIDDQGRKMPLSKYHSARVPIITGNITGASLEDTFHILEYINRDDFLRKNVIGIHIGEVGMYQLKFRVEDFVVNLGGADDLEEKFNNFKAFYTKAALDKTLDKYSLVSLEFNNQVVCTKI